MTNHYTKERRSEKRYKVSALAWFIGERSNAKGILQDINLSGAKVLSEAIFQPGEVLNITIELPGGRGNIKTLARVLWNATNYQEQHPHIIGVAFVETNQDELTKLSSYISQFDEIGVILPVRGKTQVTSLLGDLTGGTTATILGIPESIAYGTLVFAPLGHDYLGLGVIAGLIALCLSNLVSAGSRGVSIMNSGPYSLSSLMLASSVTILLSQLPTIDVSLVITLLFLIVFLSGLFQIFFGLLKLGELIKYVPYPVTAGLINGSALLIFAAQIRPLLGLPAENSLTDFAYMQPVSMLVGLVTIVTSLYGSKWIPRIPAPFVGIGSGTLLYYVLLVLGFGENLGPTIGPISTTLTTFSIGSESRVLLFSMTTLQFVPQLLSLAFGIAVVASLQTLITSISATNLLKERTNTNHELIGQGLGNIASSFLGGIVSAGSQSRTTANFIYGGRTGYSRITGGISAVAVLLFFAPVVSLLPKIVLAGILITLAIKVFDVWSLSLFSGILSKKEISKDLMADVFTVIPVMMIMLVIGVFEAVTAGIIISVGFFIIRMGKNIIRRQYDGKRIRSNIQRPLSEINYLEKFGEQICVLELEGSLFFGTADKVARVVEEILKTTKKIIVLDLRHVSDIDSTGASIIARINYNCREKGKHLLLSSAHWMKRNNTLSTLMSLFEGNIDNTACRCFDTINDALGCAEDMLLAKEYGTERYTKELPLNQFEVVKKLSAEEMEVFENYLEKVEHEAGDVVFEQDSKGENMYFLLRGRVQVVIDNVQEHEKNKIATLCPGTIFGEMATIDHTVRSANVFAETDLSCSILTAAKMEQLENNHPLISQKVFLGFTRELSKRIRIANREITELMG